MRARTSEPTHANPASARVAGALHTASEMLSGGAELDRPSTGHGAVRRRRSPCLPWYEDWLPWGTSVEEGHPSLAMLECDVLAPRTRQSMAAARTEADR
jgi:hypothetical protein